MIYYRIGKSWPELMISASVITLGITLVTSAILSAHVDSINSSRRNTVKQISLALETYYFHNGIYPQAQITDCEGYEGYTTENNDFMDSLVKLGLLSDHPADKKSTDCAIKYRHLDNGKNYEILWREISNAAGDFGCNQAPDWYCISKDY